MYILLLKNVLGENFRRLEFHRSRYAWLFCRIKFHLGTTFPRLNDASHRTFLRQKKKRKKKEAPSYSVSREKRQRGFRFLLLPGL